MFVNDKNGLQCENEVEIFFRRSLKLGGNVSFGAVAAKLLVYIVLDQKRFHNKLFAKGIIFISVDLSVYLATFL